VLGTPLVLQELAEWKAAFRPFVWVKPPWQASEIYADGSGRNPKDPQVRVVGWAFCANLPGGWVSAAGWLEPGATVTAGEATAVARALELLMVGGLVVTDCQAVWKMWHRIRRNPRTVSRGVSHPCWLLLADALGRHPSARCEWMRSHRSAEEARQAGYPAAWHEGNAKADAAAKVAALAHDVPGAVLAAYWRHKEVAEQVAGTVAAIQLFRLQARPRTTEGGAIKERRRRAPALPRRLRPKGLKRKRPSTEAAGERRAEGSRGDAAGASATALPPCERLGQAKVQELPSREAAMEVVFRSPAPAEGLHDLRPVGPWPLPGTVPARNGRVPGTWACSRCGRSAGDSSRAKQLARSPCGGAEWQFAAAKHSLELDGSVWRCSRCLLQVRPQHTAQTERQACPVGECTSGEGRWLQDEARELFGRLRAFRDFCTPEGEEEEPPLQRCRVGDQTRVHEGQVADQPRVHKGQAADQKWAQEGRPAALTGHQLLTTCRPVALTEHQLPATCTGSSGGAAAGKRAAPGVAQGLAQASPLMEAEGSEERRRLKQTAGPLAGPTGEASGAFELMGAPASLPWGGAAAQQAQRQATSSEASVRSASFGQPQPAGLQPYEGHACAFLGRNLWCLKCFVGPRSAHRSWGHGRCGGVRPPAAMPPALKDNVLPAACSELQASTRAR
jgi:ribonuclease HI